MPENRIDICTFYQERVAASQVWRPVRQTLWQQEQQQQQQALQHYYRVVDQNAPCGKEMGLSDTDASMTMDCTYAK